MKKKDDPFYRENTLRDLRIADLELLITAAHLKNLGQAARLHHLSQSAASAAIQRVEVAFSQQLCTHERRQFRLTTEGTHLIARAEVWLKNLREHVAVTALAPIRIATTHAIARVGLPAVLPIEAIELQLMRPDLAYAAVLRGDADIALVLDNAPWARVIATEIGRGDFQLYCAKIDVGLKPILLPENQIEVLTLKERWLQKYKNPLPIKARLPSWSLIADICSKSDEVGLLPDFLAKQSHLWPVPWQPPTSPYRVLALHREASGRFQERLLVLLEQWFNVFSH